MDGDRYEEKTREILEKPDGAITKKDVLAIIEFKFTDVKCAHPFRDLQWFHNLKYIVLNNCSVESLDSVEQLSLEHLNLCGNQCSEKSKNAEISKS